MSDVRQDHRCPCCAVRHSNLYAEAFANSSPTFHPSSKHSFLDLRTTTLMKAIVYHNSGSGDVLKLEEIEKPVPRDDEVLIKVRAASVNPFDYHMLRHRFL